MKEIENAVAALKSLDKDNDGKVTKEELPEFMQRMFDRADANGDGAIDKTEAESMSSQFGRGFGGGGT
jgi:Ca2+-binding EF-hand superfamily protein